MFPVSVTRVFKTASVVKPFFRKGTGEPAAFYSFVENFVTFTAVEISITCIGLFRKVALLVILRKPRLFLTGCDVIENESLTNVLKSVLKTLEKFQEVLCNGVSV